jgi:hypothetical protein
MKKDTNGYTILAVLIMVVLVTTAWAANNNPPDGWLMVNRDRAKWAMGKPIQYLGIASATNTVTNTAILAGDYVAGVVNLEDVDDAFPTLSTLTIAAGSITSAGTEFTVGEHYLITVWRPQAGR